MLGMASVSAALPVSLGGRLAEPGVGALTARRLVTSVTEEHVATGMYKHRLVHMPSQQSGQSDPHPEAPDPQLVVEPRQRVREQTTSRGFETGTSDLSTRGRTRTSATQSDCEVAVVESIIAILVPMNLERAKLGTPARSRNVA